jgi:hypothetical protein
MAIFWGSTPADQIKKLRELRVTLDDREERAREQLASLRKESGDRELEAIAAGAATVSIQPRVVELQNEVEAVAIARASLMKKLRDAIKRLNKERGDELRARAKKLEKTLAKHNAETERLRLQLEQHEGCAFIPDPFPISGSFGITQSAAEIP